jgi:alpha-1,2-mannosyltransferase
LWVLVALQFAQQTRTGFPIDFAVYRDAATNMMHGGATYRAHFTFVHLNFTYPPFALLIFSVLTMLSPLVVLAIWWLLSSVALVVFVMLALNSLTELPRRIVVPASLALVGASCLLLEPIRSSMDLGQINFFLMLAILVDVLGVRPSSRGLLTGLAAAIKLTPLMYITYFAVIRSRAAALRVLGTFVAAAVVAWLALPSDSVLFWFHQAFSPGHKGGVKGTANQSWFGLVGHFSSTLGSLTTVVWLALSVATFLLGLRLAKRYVTTARPIEALLALALTELLVSPVSWAHHWSWIILLPVILIAKWRQDRWVSGAMLLLLLVAAAAPYRWHRYNWYNHGVLPILPGFSLLFAGVVLMIAMAGTEWQRCRRERRSVSLDHKLIPGDAMSPVEPAGLSEPLPSQNRVLPQGASITHFVSGPL